MLKRSNLLKIVFVFFIAALAPLSASSSTFSFTFLFRPLAIFLNCLLLQS